MLNRVRFIMKKGYLGTPQIQLSAYPYTDTRKMISIDTGLKGRWKYSPLFCQPIADTYVHLTGSRSKDYKLAEANVNVIHTPRVNVWHHVWEKNNNGEYRMQLVDYDLHKRSCPHAGGCKLWSTENGKAYNSRGNVYVRNHLRGQVYRRKTVYRVGEIRVGQESDPYGDFVVDYIFKKDKDAFKRLSCQRRNTFGFGKRYRIWGLDPYGNIFYSDMRGNLYFYDHEMGILINIGLNENKILK